MSKEFFDLPDDCDFSRLAGNSESRNACSPVLRDGVSTKFQGLLINGPKSVIWPKDASLDDAARTPLGDVIDSPLKLVITGLVRLPSNTLGLNGWLNDGVVVIAVNQETAQAYSGKLRILGTRPKPLAPLFESGETGSPEKAAANDASLVGTWFSIDLVNNLEIPIGNADFSVYAVLGEHTSNVLTIEARVE